MKEKIGKKPKKSKDLCKWCREHFYNIERNGCWHYKDAKVIIKEVYWSINDIEPRRMWVLSCFTKKR